MLKAVVEPYNKEDKFAAAIMKNDCLVGHLSSIIFFFLRACDTNTQGDGKVIKVPCKLYFSATVV